VIQRVERQGERIRIQATDDVTVAGAQLMRRSRGWAGERGGKGRGGKRQGRLVGVCADRRGEGG